MNLFYLLAFPAWCILVLTAAVRLANIGPEQWAFTDHVRRFGLIMVGTGATVMLGTPFLEDATSYHGNTWRGTVLAWGWACVWLTTPGMPPWFDMILGVHRNTEAWKSYSRRERLRRELAALRESFKPDRYRDPPRSAR